MPSPKKQKKVKKLSEYDELKEFGRNINNGGNGVHHQIAVALASIAVSLIQIKHSLPSKKNIKPKKS